MEDVMPFGTDVSNLKLRAPDDEVENYAVAALEQLNREGVVAQVIGDFPNDFNGHLQGIAIRDKHAILTTSAKGGYLIPSKAEVSGLRFATKRSELKQIPNFNHPGGIQTIGSYVAVPVYNGVAEVHFYNYKQGFEPAACPDIKIEKANRAYSVGITNISNEEGEFYILAVGVDSGGKRFDFYRSAPLNRPIDHNECYFKRLGRWEFEELSYPNSISLIADEGETIYFLGLHTSGIKGDLGIGEDWVDLYRVDMDESEQPTRIKLTKLANFHATCREGPAFRWGGSALVKTETELRLFACERQPQQRGAVIRLNMFLPKRLQVA